MSFLRAHTINSSAVKAESTRVDLSKQWPENCWYYSLRLVKNRPGNWQNSSDSLKYTRIWK